MRRVPAILAVVLILGILGISGFAAAQSTHHDGQHSHHQTATHSSVFCSWSCAAGQTLDVATVTVSPVMAVLEILDQPVHALLHEAALLVWSSRAPPAA